MTNPTRQANDKELLMQTFPGAATAEGRGRGLVRFVSVLMMGLLAMSIQTQPAMSWSQDVVQHDHGWICHARGLRGLSKTTWKTVSSLTLATRPAAIADAQTSCLHSGFTACEQSWCWHH